MATAEVLYPTNFVDEFIPLVPGSGWGEEFDFALWELEMRGFVVALGVHDDFLGDLANMASQRHITEYCPSDPGRFGDRKKVRDWLEKGRVMVGIYAVNDREKGIDFTNPAVFTRENLEQVAYAWFGPETDDEGNPTKTITTAYRVGEAGRRLARERRLDENDKFKLGLPLGRLAIAAATDIYGVEEDDITLETWASNAANILYDLLQFVETGRKVEARPTLEPVGTVINGNEVYYDEARQQNMVLDCRLYKKRVRTAVSA